MSRPPALVLAGYGLNCEGETARALDLAGAEARTVHVADLAAAPETARDAAILAVPGGFSFGDHLGAGAALASTLRDRLGDLFAAHVARGGLVIGMCNGCQALVRLGLLGPGLALAPNAGGRYECRWVRVTVTADTPWLAGIDRLEVPVAHGEGRFVSDGGFTSDGNFTSDERLGGEAGTVALRYVGEDGAPAGGRYPDNPNGAASDAAGVTDATGRVLALMPHPERYLRAEQHPDWPRRRELARRAGEAPPEEGDGLAVFRAGVASLG